MAQIRISTDANGNVSVRYPANRSRKGIRRGTNLHVGFDEKPVLRDVLAEELKSNDLTPISARDWADELGGGE